MPELMELSELKLAQDFFQSLKGENPGMFQRRENIPFSPTTVEKKKATKKPGKIE